MTLVISVLFFLALFFLTTFFSSPSAAEEETMQRIIRRLKGNPQDPQALLRVEKKDRLSDVRLLDRFLRRLCWMEKLRLFIGQSGLEVSVGAFLLVCLLLGTTAFFSAVFLSVPWFFAMAASSGAIAIPFGVIALKRHKRFKQFSAGFPDAVSRMASSLRAGYSLQMSFEAIVEDRTNLVAEEFKHVVTELEVGQNFEEALKKMLGRIDTPELRLFISAVILQRESGGNLAQLLDNLEALIRERVELQRELAAATAQGKLSGIVLSALPLFVGVFIFAIHQDYILFFFEDPVGKRLLATSIVGQLMGFWSIWKIVHIEM